MPEVAQLARAGIRIHVRVFWGLGVQDSSREPRTSRSLLLGRHGWHRAFVFVSEIFFKKIDKF